jgi:hypothetical protein
MDLPLLGLADDLRDEWAHRSNWEERNDLLSAVFDYSQQHWNLCGGTGEEDEIVRLKELRLE